VQLDALAQQQPTQAVASPEQIVLADLDRATLWRLVLRLTVTPAERVTLIESFANGLPPRAIQVQHPLVNR
jgi:hypothetical protein